jgi:Na+-driven multidrug efflux pump
MCFFFSLIPATVFITLGYFVLFTSTKGEGTTKKFGQILAIWIFIVAMFPLIMGVYVTLSGLCPFEEMHKLMQTSVNP